MVEAPQGKILRESMEALSAGLSLQKELKTPLVGLWTGRRPEDSQLRLLSSLGVKKLIVLEDSEEAHPFTAWNAAQDALLAAVKELFYRRSPQLMFWGATPAGLCLAPRLAALLDLGYMARTTYLRRVGEILQLTRPILQDKLSEVLRFATPRQGLISLYPRAFAVATPSAVANEPSLDLEPFPLRPADTVRGRVQILSRQKDPPGFVDLEDAEVVVAGGKGMGSRQSFSLLLELAGLLEGAVAASRIAVDLGWAPKERLVGQSGRKISPELYVACGISGAPQHKVGMKDSRFILAINTDPLAPIFQVATWGILGDALQVVPELIRLLKGGQSPDKVS